MKKTAPVVIMMLALAGTELSWIWVVLDLLDRRAAGTGKAVLVLYPLSLALNSFFRLLSRRRRMAAGCLAGSAALLIFAWLQFFGGPEFWDPEGLLSLGRSLLQGFHLFNPPLAAAISGAVLWGLGWRLASSRVHFETMIGEFQFGLALLLILSFAYGQMGWPSSVLIPPALLFFVFSLSGISLSRAPEEEGGSAGSGRLRRSGLLIFTLGGILALGFLISWAVRPSLVEFLLSVLAEAGQWILRGLHKFFLFLSGFFPDPRRTQFPSPGGMGQMKHAPEVPFTLFSDSTRAVMRFLWGLMCISLLLVALWRVSSQIIGWILRPRGDGEEAEAEPLPGGFKADLLNLLKSFLRLLWIPWPFGRKEKPKPLPGRTESVRRLYRRLLARAAAGGYGRHPAQTPGQYLQRLSEWLPERRGELALMTDQYVQARYGPLPPGETALQQFREAWERVKQDRSRRKKKKISETGEKK